MPDSIDFKRECIEPEFPGLSVRRQCELLGLNRSSWYYRPTGESAENLQWMRQIDEQYLKTPFYGSRKMRDFVDKVLAHWQAFRAGIEGTISGLKRAFRLIRCFFRGFRSFSSAVGLGVFCHNLIVLAEHESG